jgi:hypothetical protein
MWSGVEREIVSFWDYFLMERGLYIFEKRLKVRVLKPLSY